MDILERLRRLPAALSGRNAAQVVYEVSDEAIDEIERLRHALHMIATHPEIHLGAAEEMATIAEHALQQKESE